MFSMLVALAAADRVIVPWIENETVGFSAYALKNCVRRSLYGPSWEEATTLDGNCPYRAWFATLDRLAIKCKCGSRKEKRDVAAFLQDVRDFLPAEIDSDLPMNWAFLAARTKKVRSVA